MLAVMNLIQKTISNSCFTIQRCYENVLYINEHLNNYKPVFQHLMSVKLLGPFSALEETYESFDFPSDLSNSCLKFFEKLFNHSYIPGNDADLDTLLHHVAFSVQFTEASSDRLDEVLELFQNVTEYLSIECQNSLDNVQCYDEVDYYDSQTCDCYDYGSNGDCSCLE